MNSLTKQHFALIIKYTGISFITGGLSHGFFSGQRQIVTALVGLVFFIVGTFLEKDTVEKRYFKTILYSSLFAIGLGALTGGLQHFPDSPERSILIVPAGFLVSFYGYTLLESAHFLKRKHILYTLVGLGISVLISLCFYWIVTGGYLISNQSHSSTHTNPIDDMTSRLGVSGQSGDKIAEKHTNGDEHISH